MPKSSNQKLKILYLMRALMENTDENHPMTVAEMIDCLAKNDIAAERKSVYDDLEALRQFGLDIVQTKSKTTGYYIGSRDFELPELKLLVDSVQSSKFITRKKTLALIKKIEALASRHDAQLLQRQVYVQNRVKTMNESVYYNVDELSAAISADRQIRFRYYEYTVSKQRRFKRDGDYYRISPYALMCDNENYYLLGYDPDLVILKHFRVDKMSDISVSAEHREGKNAFDAVNMSAYTKMVFGMFSGEKRPVKLRFASHLAGAVIDRFGKDIILVNDGEEHFTFTVTVEISPQFMAWVFGFGDCAEILAPEGVRELMKKSLQTVLNMY